VRAHWARRCIRVGSRHQRADLYDFPARSEGFAVKTGVLLHHAPTGCLPLPPGHPTGGIPRRQTSGHGRCTHSTHNPFAFLVANGSRNRPPRLGGASELSPHCQAKSRCAQRSGAYPRSHCSCMRSIASASTAAVQGLSTHNHLLPGSIDDRCPLRDLLSSPCCTLYLPCRQRR
jgi:hypothetical protein